MLMGQRVDKGSGRRARIKADPKTGPKKKYKKREAIASRLMILTDHPIRAAASRSRLRIMLVLMNHRSRRLPFIVAPRMPSRSRSTMMAWMVPLWRLGSSPSIRTRSEQVWGPDWIRMERMAMRMMVEKFIGGVVELRES